MSYLYCLNSSQLIDSSSPRSFYIRMARLFTLFSIPSDFPYLFGSGFPLPIVVLYGLLLQLMTKPDGGLTTMGCLSKGIYSVHRVSEVLPGTGLLQSNFSLRNGIRALYKYNILPSRSAYPQLKHGTALILIASIHSFMLRARFIRYNCS